jgi:hypothetical protein
MVLRDSVLGSCVVWIVATEQKQTAGIGKLKKLFLSPPHGDDDLLNDLSCPDGLTASLRLLAQS